MIEINLIDDSSLRALVIMCIITAVTPGPNNFIVLSASASEGKLGALPPYLGVCLGFPLMVFTVSYLSVVLGGDFLKNLYFVKYLGVAFLLYLSFKLISSKSTHKIQCFQLSFIQAFLFQWANPKAWAMVLSTLAIVGMDDYQLPALVYLVVVFPCVGVWLLFGDLLKKYVVGTYKEIILNRILGSVLAVSTIMLL